MNDSHDPQLLRLIASLLVVRASGFLADHQRRYPRWELANAELRQLLEQGPGSGWSPEVTAALRRRGGGGGAAL
jgi:hypothetical protein